MNLLWTHLFWISWMEHWAPSKCHISLRPSHWLQWILGQNKRTPFFVIVLIQHSLMFDLDYLCQWEASQSVLNAIKLHQKISVEFLLQSATLEFQRINSCGLGKAIKMRGSSLSLDLVHVIRGWFSVTVPHLSLRGWYHANNVWSHFYVLLAASLALA